MLNRTQSSNRVDARKGVLFLNDEWDNRNALRKALENLIAMKIPLLVGFKAQTGLPDNIINESIVNFVLRNVLQVNDLPILEDYRMQQRRNSVQPFCHFFCRNENGRKIIYYSSKNGVASVF